MLARGARLQCPSPIRSLANRQDFNNVSDEPIEALGEALLRVAGDYQARCPSIRLSEQRVVNWLSQFPESERQPLLAETLHVLTSTYISQHSARTLLARFVDRYLFHESTVSRFREQEVARTHFLRTQPRASSQDDLLRLLDDVLDNRRVKRRPRMEMAAAPTRFVYLDDGLFTGYTAAREILGSARQHGCIREMTPDSELWIVVLGFHREGWTFLRNALSGPLSEQRVVLRGPFHHLELHGRHLGGRDVFWPTAEGVTKLEDDAVSAYVEARKRELAARAPRVPLLRRPAKKSAPGCFSSSARRDLLERRLLQLGVRIHTTSSVLRTEDRPLGFERLISLGFGSPLVTYRNAPNNSPLAWHSGPRALLPRTNRHSTSHDGRFE